MLSLLKVAGDSLSPEYAEGDFVLIAKIPFWLSPIKPGDVIVFRHHAHGLMIKRVACLLPDGAEIEVIGAHPDSQDSRTFGPINRRLVVGKVIWRIRKPRL
jgi:phage repressor protein C with HTH and peptisase S24 domain